MELIKELEDKINTLTKSIALATRQLEDHKSGDAKLSYMAEASTEANKERNTFLLEKYQKELLKLKALDIKELNKKYKEQKAVVENNYFKYQEARIKRHKTKSDKLKEEAIMLLNELPPEIQIKDEEIFPIAQKSLELNLKLHCELHNDLEKIKDEFEELTKDAINDENQYLLILNQRIPILILRFSILIQNIQENIKDEQLSDFRGVPKFEDWWISELWRSHQAYIALFKWKDIINYLCLSQEQKRTWSVIFKNWVFVKKFLHKSGESAYVYNNAFDTLIKKHAQLEDEFDESNLNSMKKVIENITKKEDFITINKDHNVLTPYLQFKLNKIEELRKKENEKRGLE
jgi:mRNA-degrading endonuclease YafQ of YafQ-DinJ toxin-antitoxin module